MSSIYYFEKDGITNESIYLYMKIYLEKYGLVPKLQFGHGQKNMDL